MRIWHIESDTIIGAVKVTENDPIAQTLFAFHNQGKIQLKSFSTSKNELEKDTRPPYFNPIGVPDTYNLVGENNKILLNNLPLLDDSKADQLEVASIEQTINGELIRQHKNPKKYENDSHMTAQLISVSGTSPVAYFAVKDSDYKNHLEPLMPIIKEKFGKEIKMYTIKEVTEIEEGKRNI